MAKKDPPPDADDQPDESSSDSAMADETVQFDADMESHNLPRASSDVNDHDRSDDPGGESTLIPDLSETLVPDDEGEASTGVDPSKKTVGPSDLEKTVEAEAIDREQVDPLKTTRRVGEESSEDLPSANKTIVSVGRGSNVIANKKTVIVSNEGTTTDLDVIDRGKGTVDDASPSIMTSSNISGTINPRELSDKDAAFWGSLSMERDSKQDPSVLPPAIDRSLTESKLQIRGRHVVPPSSDASEPSDYRLVRLLGKGGMGNVYVARQGSLDRLLAVKVIKPLDRRKREKLKRSGRLEAVEQERRQQFLSEAVVTGDLDHPNIVPIHDIAVTADNTLFYSMKRVMGTPWSKVIASKTLSENLDILIKAADAVGFAHTRGVVHRDIKPENIMLGEYGEVMVMDWGLALPTPGFEKIDSIFPSTGLGGSPAFMAPEMAVGPIQKIGPASDIYLFGATLFLIITGSPPHEAANVSECLKVVASNKIREVAPHHRGELLDIAMKAMSTRIEDRYPDVKSFQDAVRDYISHAQSIELRDSATKLLHSGIENRSYDDFSRAAFGFEKAVELWDGNREAQQGLAETKLAYADVAYQNGDFDLGLSLLDEQSEEHRPVIEKLRQGVHTRDSRKKRIRGLQLAAAALLAVIIVGGSIALYTVRQAQIAAENAADAEKAAKIQERDAKNEAIAAKDQEKFFKEQAEKDRDTAKAAEDQAKKDRDAAEKSALAEKAAKEREKSANAQAQRDRLAAEKAALDALAAQRSAEKSTAAARRATARAEYEEFVSKIGLAKARIERKEFSDARTILRDLQSSLDERGIEVGWEWRWLWTQANQSQSSIVTPSAAKHLAVAPSGRRAMVTLADGTLDLLSLSPIGMIDDQFPIDHLGVECTATAFSPDGQFIAIATFDGDAGAIQLHDLRMQRLPVTFKGRPLGRINDLKYTDSGTLVSASDDRTARLWDPSEGNELAVCWHIASVVQVDVAQQGSTIVLAAAVADDVIGKVVVWEIAPELTGWSEPKRRADFLEHRSAVSSLALTRDGRQVASGDVSGRVLIWEPKNVPVIDYSQSIAKSIANLAGRQQLNESLRNVAAATARELSDPTDADPIVQLVSTSAGSPAKASAHSDVVRTIRFSDDGKSLLTGSDDYTLKIWNVDGDTLNKTLKGHGGWVTAADFPHGTPDLILSVSNDETVRSWAPDRYVSAALIATAQQQEQAPVRQLQSHEDEIWSASFNHAGDRVISASRDHTARLLKVDPLAGVFEQIAVIEDDEKRSGLLVEGSDFVALSLAIVKDRLYIGSADADVRIWDLRRATQLSQATGTGLNDSLAVSPSGNWMLTGSSDPEFKALLWRTTADQPPKVVHKLKGHDQAVTALAISSDETRLFTGDRNGYGILWDRETGRRLGAPIEAARGFRINAATFSSDGNELLIASDKQQLTRVDLRAREIIGRMQHDGFVTRLSVSADGKYALTVSEQLTTTRLRSAATLWDIESGEHHELDSLDLPLQQKARITSAEFGSLSRQVVIGHSATGESPATLEFWQLGERPSQVKSTRKLELPVRLGTAAIALPIGSDSLVTLNGEAAFRWNLATTALEKSYRAHAAVTQASFSRDGKYVATGSRSVKIWDANTGAAVAKLENPHREMGQPPGGAVRTVQFQPTPTGEDKNYVLATGGDDGIVRTWQWDRDEFTKLHEYKSDTAVKRILGVCFSPDGKSLMAVGSGGSVRVWQLDAPGSPTIYDPATTSDMTCCEFSPEGKYILVGSNDRKARMWKVVDSKMKPQPPIVFAGHAEAIKDVAILQDKTKQIRVLTAAQDKSARVWDPRLDMEPVAGQPRSGREIISLRQHGNNDVTAVDASLDGNFVVTAGSDGSLVLSPAGNAPPALPRPNLFEEVLDPEVQ